jgi:hypothetical protein
MVRFSRSGSLSFGSACGCVLGAAITVWAALQIWHGVDQANSDQLLAQSRPEFLVASQSQTEIRRMAQRMIMR